MNTNRMAYLLMLMALAVATLLHKRSIQRHSTPVDRVQAAVKGLGQYLKPGSSVKVESTAGFWEFFAVARYALVPVHLDVKGDRDTFLSLSPIGSNIAADSGRRVLWQSQDDLYTYTLSKR